MKRLPPPSAIEGCIWILIFAAILVAIVVSLLQSGACLPDACNH